MALAKAWYCSSLFKTSRDQVKALWRIVISGAGSLAQLLNNPEISSVEVAIAPPPL
jgi:hypothetical protein